jgi:hypothetical protein
MKVSEEKDIIQKLGQLLNELQQRQPSSEAEPPPPIRLVPRTFESEENCVNVLTALLERAKRGEFREFVFAATNSKEDALGHFTWTRSNNLQRLIGQVRVLEQILVNHAVQQLTISKP